jgi:predicted thioesterase
MSESSAAAESPLPPPGPGSPAALLADLVERAAVRLMRRGLLPGQNSVAVALNVNHLAHTDTPFAHWNVTVRRTAQRGRLQEFRVEVFDDRGLIASAEHTRAVVVARRFLAQARKRAGFPAMLLQV